VPNFIEIAETLAEIWRFFDFLNGGRRRPGFLKLRISNSGTRNECRIGSSFQISWRSVKPLPRYLDFGFFKMAAAAFFYF